MKLLVFDLDGTILDTMSDISASLNYSLKTFGYPTHTKERVCTFLGHGAVHLTRAAMGYSDTDEVEQAKLDEVYNLYMETYHKNRLNLTREFDNVTTTLVELKKRGYVLGVISNKPIVDANPIINHYFEHIFDFVVGTEKNGYRKPSEKMADYIYNNYEVTKDDIYYFGDSFVDAEFATNCGFKYYLFNYGYGDNKLLHTYHPEAFLDSFDALLEIFK